MRSRARNPQSRKGTVVVAAVLLTIAVVCFYGAYLLGQTSFEEIGNRKLRAMETQVRAKRALHVSCLDAVERFKKGQMQAAELEAKLEEDAAELIRSTEGVHQAIIDTQRDVTACRDDVRRKELERVGALIDVMEMDELSARALKTSGQFSAASQLGRLTNVAWLTEQRARLEPTLAALMATLKKGGSQCPRDGYAYSVVFDIGSTGNRVHAFKFRVPLGVEGRPTLAQLELEESLFRINEVGLSKFADPVEAVASLNPLFAAAEAYVPAAHHRCTPVQFKATAGLRKTSKAFAEAVLDGIRRHFSASDTLWLRGPSPARILEGGEEGPLAWLTVNYLLGNFKRTAGASKTRAATIDLGGGSAQIVFEPPRGTLTDRPPSLLFRKSIDGQDVEAYQHSYEGLGLMAATEQLMQSVLGQCGLEPPVALPWEIHSDLDSDDQHQEEQLNRFNSNHFPCFPVGYREPATGVENIGKDADSDSTADAAEVAASGGASFDACATLFQTAVLRDWVSCREPACGVWGVYQPSLTNFTGDVFAFSFVYDIMKPFFEPGASIGRFSVNRLSAIGREVCSSLTLDNITREVAETNAGNRTDGRPRALQPQRMCMYHAYVYALLSAGLKVPQDVIMRVEKKINGFEASWALGAALLDM